jgi:hypothetical protein
MSASEIARILPRIDEEGQLPKQRQRRPAIPFDMHRAGETVEAHACGGPTGGCSSIG